MQPIQTPRPVHRTRRVFQLALSLAGLALLVIVISLAMQTRPQPAAGIATATATTQQPSPTASTVPTAAPRRLLAGLCPAGDPSSTTPTPQNPGALMERGTQGELGGGEVTSGDFTFDLRLVCDPAFRPDSPAYDTTSEFEGIGIIAAWSYHGASVQGETVDFAGIQPYVSVNGTIGPALDDGTGSSLMQGVRFPATVFIDFPAGDLTFSYIVKLKAPDDRQAGAELRFTLRPEPDGYRPVDVAVRPVDVAVRPVDVAVGALDPNTLSGEATPAPADYTLLPTLAAAQIDPTLGRLAEQIAAWESNMLDRPGWLYISQKIENEGGGGLQPNGMGIPAVRVDENWYLLDENGYVQRSITRQLDEQGSPLQISVMSDGQYRNLTLGDSGPSGDPWRPDFFNFYNEAAQAARQGVVISETAVDVNGVAAAQFALDFSGYRTSIAIDAASGQPLVYERWSSPGPGQPAALEQRFTTLTLERIDAPPAEISALFEATPAPYRPADPLGTPAPEGFDPSSSYITMNIVPADSVHKPTFFFGDLYAQAEPPPADGIPNAAVSSLDGFLLGRVDFGAVPGGWCDRSADGSRMAFSWVFPGESSPGEDTHLETRLRWFDLSASGLVYEPDPEIALHSSVAFASSGYRLAFFACKQEACGLYLLEADGDSATARLLTPGLLSSAPPTWKPDDAQIASERIDDQGSIVLTIVDAQSGAIVYQGPRLGSPFESWGASIVEGQSSFERCVAP